MLQSNRSHGLLWDVSYQVEKRRNGVTGKQCCSSWHTAPQTVLKVIEYMIENSDWILQCQISAMNQHNNLLIKLDMKSWDTDLILEKNWMCRTLVMNNSVCLDSLGESAGTGNSAGERAFTSGWAQEETLRLSRSSYGAGFWAKRWLAVTCPAAPSSQHVPQTQQASPGEETHALSKTQHTIKTRGNKN